MELSDLELIAIYAALTHSIEVCDIYWEQEEDVGDAADEILSRVALEMERRNLLES